MNAIEREKNGKKVQVEYRIVRPDGSLRWIWDRAFPIVDDSGKVNSRAQRLDHCHHGYNWQY
jgi:hypothetical protein